MNAKEYDMEELAKLTIGCAIKVHSALGLGLLESAYKECLCYELLKHDLFVEKEKPIPLIYEDVKLEVGYRMDLLVNHQLVVEIKSKELLTDVDLAQTLTYMKLGDFRLGLLINFNVSLLKQGLKRVVNKL